MIGGKKVKRSKRSLNADRKRRSKQPWERARGAPKKGNPRYMPKMIKDKNGVRRKVYVLRK